MLVIRRITIGLIGLGFSLALIYFFVFHIGAVSPPKLEGQLRSHQIERPEGQRTFSYYLPQKLASPPALIYALHGSRGDGQLMRKLTAYEFDRLADEHGFIVVYPDGYQNHWNDCRASASYAANTENIDDPAFFKALSSYFEDSYQSDSARQFYVGYSNGAHVGFRLIFESPDQIAALAAVAANLPVAESRDCELGDTAVPLALFNGTEDPVNPYQGGLVEILGDDSRGTVHSSDETMAYFRELSGISSQGLEVRYPERDDNEDTSVVLKHWKNSEGIDLRLYTLEGSGHVVPSRHVRYGSFFGQEAGDIEAAQEIWAFFEGL